MHETVDQYFYYDPKSMVMKILNAKSTIYQLCENIEIFLYIHKRAMPFMQFLTDGAGPTAQLQNKKKRMFL